MNSGKMSFFLCPNTFFSFNILAASAYSCVIHINLFLPSHCEVIHQILDTFCETARTFTTVSPGDYMIAESFFVTKKENLIPNRLRPTPNFYNIYKKKNFIRKNIYNFYNPFFCPHYVYRISPHFTI